MLCMSGVWNEPQAWQKGWTPTADSYDSPWPGFLRLFIFIPPRWRCVMSETIRCASWAGCPFIQITTLVVEGYRKQMGPLVRAIWGATATVGWRWWWWRERPGLPPSSARPSNPVISEKGRKWDALRLIALGGCNMFAGGTACGAVNTTMQPQQQLKAFLRGSLQAGRTFISLHFTVVIRGCFLWREPPVSAEWWHWIKVNKGH